MNAALVKAKAAPKEAEATLRAVLTAPPRDKGGFIKRKGSLNACNAEVDAVLALAKVLAAAKNYGALVELAAHLKGCRKAGDRSQEVLIWLAGRSRYFGNLKAGQRPEIGEAINRMHKAAYLVGRSDRQLAKAFFRALPSYGLHRVGLGDYKRVKRTSWVLMRDIHQPKLSRKSLKYVYDRTFQESYDCKLTKQIIGFNVVTGKWDYKTRCKTRSVKIKASVATSLVQPPPAWAKKAGRFQPVWVVGKITKLGPNWRLTKSTMVDLRFLKWRQPR
ncbi:MAG: hypothetical protein JRH20_31425 [Deltaproteobacteria bacterium]|nr:hypothetical protein [Deltaproteobacteria bacterium]